VITVSVSNATTDERIADANVEATVSHGTDFTSNFEGITHSDGEYTFELNIDQNAPTGEFTTSVDVSAAGCEDVTETTTFEVISGSEAARGGEAREENTGVEEAPSEEGEESGRSDNDEANEEVLLCSTFNDLWSSE
jgi:hypothetical protein